MKNFQAIAWCDRTMAFSLYALIWFIPISIAFVESFFGLALLAFWIKRLFQISLTLKNSSQGRGLTLSHRIQLFISLFVPVESVLNRPIAVFILAGFLSIFVSEYKALSIQGFFFKLLEWTFLYFIFIEAINHKRRLKIFIGVFFLSALLICINGLIQQITGREFIWGSEMGLGRVSSSFRHPNDFGGYLVVVLPLLFSFLYVYRKGRRVQGRFEQEVSSQEDRTWQFFRWAAWGLFLLAALCMGFTYSRGAWLAFFLGLVFLGLQKPKYILFPLGFVIIFTAIFSSGLEEKRRLGLFTDQLSPRMEDLNMQAQKAMAEARNPQSQRLTKEAAAEPTKERSATPGSAPEPSSSEKSNFKKFFLSFVKKYSGSGRSLYWRDSFSLIRNSPWLGIGINTYSQVSMEKKLAWGGYPHNCYLQLTAEMGLMGLISFIWIMGTLFRFALRRSRQIRDPFLYTVLWGGMAGLLSFLAQSSVDTNFYSVQLGNLMWLALGMIVSSIQIYDRSQNQK